MSDRARGGRVRRLSRRFYARHPLEVAPALLNKVLVVGRRAGRIVEVEAYCGADDPASHAYRGRTRRNATMFGAPGGLYVYFTYGMHWCANAVCLPEGVAGAVLLRALSPLAGVEAMRAARSDVARERDIASGPAKLCQALGLTGDNDGADLVTGAGGVRVVDDGMSPPTDPGVSGRIGLREADDRPWRWWVPGDPNVSRPPPRGAAGLGAVPPDSARNGDGHARARAKAHPRR